MSTENGEGAYGGGQKAGSEPQAESGQEAAFYSLVGRALVDPDFRVQLRGGDQAAALKAVGVEPTPELLDALSKAMGEVDRMASHFGDIKAAT